MTKGELNKKAREFLDASGMFFADSTLVTQPGKAPLRWSDLRAILRAFIGESSPADAGKTRICVECRFVNYDTYNSARCCRHPINRDLVTGRMLFIPCNTMRYDRDTCGKDGRLYEPKDGGE